MSSASDTGLIIGVGHADRQDDGVGPDVARALHRRGLPAIAHEGDGTGLLDLWQDRSTCIVVDALSGLAPGTVSASADMDDPGFRRAAFVHSTHRLGLPEAVALGRTLGRLPQRLIVVGIAGAAFGFGEGLSAPVAAAAQRLIERLGTVEHAFDDDLLAGLVAA